MITIREVTIDDITEIATLSHQLGYSITDRETELNIKAIKQSEFHAAFVAVYENIVIGWIGVSYNISLESPPLCEIRGLVVHEQYRSKGVGRMLIDKAKEWGRSKEVNNLRLRCNVKRLEAISFYQKVGFSEVKQQKVFEMKL
jgi:GNAT superfamily N-acetyltransferase